MYSLLKAFQKPTVNRNSFALHIPEAAKHGREIPIPMPKMKFRPGKHLLALCLLLFVFVYGLPLLRLIDPAAGIIDIGALSLLFTAVVALTTAITSALWVERWLWPQFRDFRKQQFSDAFKSLTPWQQIIVSTGSFFLLLFACVCCLLATM